eukprot:8061167-Pyramimonas_sp.AAC.1
MGVVGKHRAAEVGLLRERFCVDSWCSDAGILGVVCSSERHSTRVSSLVAVRESSPNRLLMRCIQWTNDLLTQ